MNKMWSMLDSMESKLKSVLKIHKRDDFTGKYLIILGIPFVVSTLLVPFFQSAIVYFLLLALLVLPVLLYTIGGNTVPGYLQERKQRIERENRKRNRRLA